MLKSMSEKVLSAVVVASLTLGAVPVFAAAVRPPMGQEQRQTLERHEMNKDNEQKPSEMKRYNNNSKNNKKNEMRKMEKSRKNEQKKQQKSRKLEMHKNQQKNNKQNMQKAAAKKSY